VSFRLAVHRSSKADGRGVSRPAQPPRASILRRRGPGRAAACRPVGPPARAAGPANPSPLLPSSGPRDSRSAGVKELVGPVENRPTIAGGRLVAPDGVELLGSQALEPADDLGSAQRVVVGQRPPDDGGGRRVWCGSARTGRRRRGVGGAVRTAAPVGVSLPNRPSIRPPRQFPLPCVTTNRPTKRALPSRTSSRRRPFGDQLGEVLDHRHGDADRSERSRGHRRSGVKRALVRRCPPVRSGPLVLRHSPGRASSSCRPAGSGV
jgi:hypothetical protein